MILEFIVNPECRWPHIPWGGEFAKIERSLIRPTIPPSQHSSLRLEIAHKQSREYQLTNIENSGLWFTAMTSFMCHHTQEVNCYTVHKKWLDYLAGLQDWDCLSATTGSCLMGVLGSGPLSATSPRYTAEADAVYRKRKMFLSSYCECGCLSANSVYATHSWMEAHDRPSFFVYFSLLFVQKHMYMTN